MGLDADGMKRPCGLLEMQGGTGSTCQICTDRGEGGVLSPSLSLEVAEDRGKPLGFMVQADRMFQQLFPLIGHEVDQRIGGEREHPIAREQAEQCGRCKADRGEGEEALDDQQ